MRIVVVDDFMSVCEAVARCLEPVAYDVVWAPSPEALADVLPHKDFDLAFVDLDFGRLSRLSGLNALRQLEERGVPAVLYSADSEDNRLLYLLAAFQFFRPLGLASKMTSGAQIREIAQRAEQGRPLGMDFHGTAYRCRADAVPWLDRLLPTDTDLGIWRQLAHYANRRVIATGAHVATSTVDNFSARQIEVVRELRSVYAHWDGGPASAATVVEREKLAPLHAFAVTHARFFEDPEIDRIVRGRRGRGR